MAHDFLDLTQRSQDNLVGFLRIETKLAETFYKISKNTKDAEHRAKLQGDIKTAVKTLRQFLHRINDTAIRRELSREADRLEKMLG